MKTWTMPKVVIEEYAANDYVAACEHTGTGFSLLCDNSATHDHGFGQYTDDWGACSVPASFPSGALINSSGASYKNSVTYDSNGNHLYGLDGTLDAPVYGALDSSRGQTNANYVFQAFYHSGNGCYYYNVYTLQSGLFGIKSYSRSGWHAALGDPVANPTS